MSVGLGKFVSINCLTEMVNLSHGDVYYHSAGIQPFLCCAIIVIVVGCLVPFQLSSLTKHHFLSYHKSQPCNNTQPF